MNKCLYDVFISYSRKDSKIVLPIVERLKEEGCVCWMDIDGIESSDEFKRVLVKAIRQSKLVIFFSSENSNNTEWTVKEINIAVQLKKPIIPVLLDDTPYDDSILFDLSGVDYVQLVDFGIRNAGIERLVRAVKSKVGARSVSVVNEEDYVAQLEKCITNNEWCDLSRAGFLFPIQDKFYLNGIGTVVTGVVWRGKLNVSDAVEIIGHGRVQKAQVVGIESMAPRMLKDYCGKDDNVGLLLRGVKHDDVDRGDFIAQPKTLNLCKRFEAGICVEGGVDEVKRGNLYEFYIGTNDFTGRIEAGCVKSGDYGLVSVCLDDAIGLERGMRFAIRQNGNIISVGSVISG